ncbi:MAG: glycosyltransferase [Chitinophagaceae bacterium]
MISILIPVFNRPVDDLVKALRRQLAAVKERVELVVMDDCSTDTAAKNANRMAITGFADTQYIELSSNAGRNLIRHKLAAAAKYSTLIFIDADSSFPDEQWLQRYLDAYTGKTVVMGGRSYRKVPAGSASLHWKYGSVREQQPAAMRNQYPWRSFLACNFMVSKEQLSQLIVDPHLQGYCHEDTFMGLQFQQLAIPVIHIDNPVYHDGIDEDSIFIAKQEEALENLIYLFRSYDRQYHFSTEVKLLRVYKKITTAAAGNYMLDKLTNKKGLFRRKALQSHSLFWLDCWKLVVFHALSERHV